MIYLSGNIHKNLLYNQNIGFMKTPNMGNRVPRNHYWGLDSGCFNQKDFSWMKYYTWSISHYNSHCLFLTMPDAVGDAEETLNQFNRFYNLFKQTPYNLAFVAQDGITKVDIPWEKFHTLFIGGTTDWKLSEEVKEIINQGQLRNKWIHIGRVNSYRRMKIFAELKVNSMDGTFSTFGPDINIPKLIKMVEKINEEYYTS